MPSNEDGADKWVRLLTNPPNPAAPGNLAAKSKVTAAPAGARLTCCFPQPPGRTHPPLCPTFSFKTHSSSPSSRKPSRFLWAKAPTQPLTSWSVSGLGGGFLPGHPPWQPESCWACWWGPLCPGPSWTWCSGTCVQRETLWAMPAFWETRLDTSVAANLQPRDSVSTGKPALP